MGDRWELEVKCAYCHKLQEELVYYAPTCNSMTFECDACGKESFITIEHKVKRIKDVIYEDVFQAVDQSSTMMTDKHIEAYAKEYFGRLKKNDI